MLDKTFIEQLGYFDFKAFIGSGFLHPGGLFSTIEVFRNAKINGGAPMLEVGCGNGYTTLKLLKAGYNVQPVDINPSMVQATERNLKENGYFFVKPLVCSAENLVFPDDAFSMILLEAVFGFIQNKPVAISEFHRVLKNSGMVGYVDMHYVSAPHEDIVMELSSVFGYPIEPLYKQDWLAIHEAAEFELHYWNDYPMQNVRMPTFEQLKNFLTKRHKDCEERIVKECAEIVLHKSHYYESIFIKNRKHLKYHVALFKKKDS